MIDKILIKVKTWIQTIKTSQKMQNDSYKFYRYKSDNLYTTSGGTYIFEFVPETRKASDVLCVYKYSSYLGLTNGMSGSLSIYPNNPLRARVAVPSSSSLPSWEQAVYVEVYATCKGFLRRV